MIKYWNLYFHPFRNRSSANTCSREINRACYGAVSLICDVITLSSEERFRHMKAEAFFSSMEMSSTPSWPDAAPMSKLFFRPLR